MSDSFQSSNTFLRSNNFNDQTEGRRSHQIFSFNPPQQNNQSRNTVQDRRDINNIMQRYSSKPQGSNFQSNFVSQSIQQSKNEENQGPVNFLDSQNFEDDDNKYKQQSNQTYQVNYPNVLDEDTSLMTSLNVSRNPNDTHAFNGVVNPFMKNFDNSIRTDLDDINDNNQNYDKFHKFESLNINQLANQNNNANNGERMTFGGFNNSSLFDTQQSQANNGGQSNNQQSQVNYSISESQQNKNQGTQQNFKGISNSTVSSQSNYSQNPNMVSGQFGYQQSGNFGGQSQADYYGDNDDNLILKDINNDDFGDNIFGSNDDLTKQEEQEQRVNQMHAEISVLNDQVHKMLQNYKTQLDKQSDKKQVKQKVQKDASLLSKNYREIICKFDDLSQNDISMLSNSMSMNSRSNMSFAGNSLLRGTTKKEKEINVMMNLVEQFLCKFDDDFQSESVSRQDSPQQKINNGMKQQQDAQYNKMIQDQSKQNDLQLEFNKLTMQQKQDMPKSPLAQQYQLQNVNKSPQPPIQTASDNKNLTFQTQAFPQQQQEQNTGGKNIVSFDKAATDLASKYAKLPSVTQSYQQPSQSNITTSTQNAMLDMDNILMQHKKDHQDNPFLSVQIQSPNSISYGNTPVSNEKQPQIFFNGSFKPQTEQMSLIEESEAVKRTQMPQLKQTSSAQPTLAQISSNPTSPAVSPIQTHVYSQSTRTSGVNQFSLANTYGIGDQKSNNFLTPQKPTNYTIVSYSANNSLQGSMSNIPIQNVKSPVGSQNSLQVPSGSTLQVPNSPSLIAQNTSSQNTHIQNTTNNNNKSSDIFNTHDQLDLYCTNCDQYFKSNVYFEHVKTCDKEHANKLNQTLDDTFYSLDQSAAIMNKLDQKIDKISRNISNALQLQNLPQTRDILSETIRDLADTLKSENSQIVKKIIRKIEQNAKKLDAASGNLPQSSSHKLYLYLKRVTNILREKETALEQSAMLKEISLVYQPKQTPPPAQQEQQQNFYAPRYSYQPNSNANVNNTFTRNTVSTNTELEKKSRFYDLAGGIKNNLPPSHFGNQFLISELYEEAKNLQENEWQNYLKNKFHMKS